MFNLRERFEAACQAWNAPFGPREIYKMVENIQSTSKDHLDLPQIRSVTYNRWSGFCLEATSSLVCDSVEWRMPTPPDGRFNPDEVLYNVTSHLCDMGLRDAPIAKARVEAIVYAAYREAYPPAIFRATKEFLDPGANTPTVAY